MSELDDFIFRSLEEEIYNRLSILANTGSKDEIWVRYWEDCQDEDWIIPVYADWSRPGIDDVAFAVCDLSVGTISSQADYLASQLFDYFYPVAGHELIRQTY